MKQFLLAIDQALNCLVWAKGEGFGKADEALSARAWRLRERASTWGRFQRLVDQVFFWQLEHCRVAYESEVLRRQLPREYRTAEVKT